jgi:hypothetical protein
MTSLFSFTKSKPSRTLEALLILAGKRTVIDDAVVEGKLKLPELFTLPDGEWELTCECGSNRCFCSRANNL